MKLHRLVYYSQNRLPEGKLTPEVIEDILSVSRCNNARVGITGALIFNSGCFGQVLEGSADAVEATFERIQQDERHGDVSLLGFEAVPTRAFEAWSMGFVGASAEAGRPFSSVADRSGFDPSALSGHRLFEALHRLALEEERAAA